MCPGPRKQTRRPCCFACRSCPSIPAVFVDTPGQHVIRVFVVSHVVLFSVTTKSRTRDGMIRIDDLKGRMKGCSRVDGALGVPVILVRQ
jgi:hypothetical protein